MQTLKKKVRSEVVRSSKFGVRNYALARSRRSDSHSACRTPHSGLLRPAFTMVEMLVVIMIIGILVGLAVPVYMNVRTKAVEARVANELKGLESAIAAFRAKYGVEPPSRFTLYLTQAGWQSDPTSMAVVRQIWPQFDFTLGDSTGAGLTKGTYYPAFWWDTVGGTNHVINMNSSECLLFFVGGIIPTAGQNQAPTGFAKNPIYPFAPMNVATSTNTNREGPFFEMSNVSQIKDSDGNGMNEWYDSIPNQLAPILYFSSYGGAGYRVTGTTSELPSGNTLLDVYRVWSPPTGTPNATVPSAGTATQTLTAQKPQSFQLISPGYDGRYGAGGVFNSNLTNSGLTDGSGNADLLAYDNITNFSGGRLKP